MFGSWNIRIVIMNSITVFCLLVSIYLPGLYCGGQAWLSAGTWFNDTYVMNSFYQLFFSLPLMSNNGVPATSNWFWLWLPAAGTHPVHNWICDSMLRYKYISKVNKKPGWWSKVWIFLSNFRRRRKRLTDSTQYFSPQSLFCLLTSVRPERDLST